MSGPLAAHPGATGSSDFTVRPARPEDEPAIEAMFLECFGTPRSSEEWRWRWFGASGGHGEALILESGGVPVGHWAGAAADMWLEGKRKRMMVGGEVMVLPAFRRRGGMGMLVRAGRERAFANADVLVGFATEDATRISGANGGGPILGRVPAWIVWPKRIPSLPGPIGSLAARVLRMWRATAFAVLPCAAVEILTTASSEVDGLAASAAVYAGCMRIRDSAYLRWRWLERPEGEVTVLAARTRSGTLSGYAVTGVETDARIGRVLDLLAVDRRSLRGLLRRSLADLTAAGCEVITCDYVDPRPWPRSVLRLAGFMRRPGKLVTCLCTSPDTGVAPERLESWYFTRGDTDVS